MGKLTEIRQSYFGKGMTNLLRAKNFDYAQLVGNFDIYSDPTKMRPNPDFAADSIESLTVAESKLCKFLAGPSAADGGTEQYALGVVSGTTKAKIFRKTVASSDAWAAATTGEDSNTGRNENFFVLYPRTVLWGARGGVRLWSYQIGSNTFDTSGAASHALTYTQIFQGLVHSKDDILYIPYYSAAGSFIAKYNGTTWTDTALTLPASMIPICISEFGNYLAIACKQKNIQSGPSIVFLWDRDSSLTTLSESINWGPESLEMIEELDGVLVGVSVFANTSTESFISRPKLVFKAYTGGTPQAKQFLEIPLTSSTVNSNQLPTVNLVTGGLGTGVAIDRQKINNRVFFPLSCEINNVQYDAVWAITRLSDGSLSVSIDRLYNNDTAVTSGEPKGLFKFGDYMTVAFEDNSVYKANDTISGAATYTAQTSVYETLIMGEPYLKFKLNSVGVMTEPLPGGGTVVVKYKKDAETAFTTIFSHTTVTAGSFVTGTRYTILSVGTTDFTLVGASANTVGVEFDATGAGSGTGVVARTPLFHEANKIEGAGNLPEFRELTLRIESTGGAVVIGYWAQAEQVSKGLVNRILQGIRGWL